MSTDTLSIRLEVGTKKRLDALSRTYRRSRSFLAAEAIEAYVAMEESQLADIQAGMEDLDAGRSVDHDEVVKWVRSWGTPNEIKPPL